MSGGTLKEVTNRRVLWAPRKGSGEDRSEADATLCCSAVVLFLIDSEIKRHCVRSTQVLARYSTRA